MILDWFKRTKHEPVCSVLLVSDDANSLALAEALHEKGYTMCSVATGDEAIRMLDQIERPDIFILDFKNPETEGKKFLENVRIRLGRTGLPPILLLADEKADETLAHDMGAQDVLPKPVDVEQITERVLKLVPPKPAVEKK